MRIPTLPALLSMCLALAPFACSKEKVSTQAADGGPLQMGTADPSGGGRGEMENVAEELLPSEGWLDPMTLIVASDGSRELGNTGELENSTRDQGSKILYFDVEAGNNDTAEVYWWDGTQIIDSKGKAENRDGEAYGTDPLQPNEAAILPFKEAIGMQGNADGDPRLRTNSDGFEAVAGGYPDWYLLRRGQTHVHFDALLVGGRTPQEPMVIAGYGPPREGRARISPVGEEVDFQGTAHFTRNPFSGHNFGAAMSWMHTVMLSLEFTEEWSHLGTDSADSPTGGPVTAYAEDCKWWGGTAKLVYLPQSTVVRRSVITGNFNPDQHNQGYYAASPRQQVTFDQVIFYKNGYKSNPRTEPDPRRDVFSRNIYQGGGAQMGHTYRGIISADGASAGPQMRLGGTMENSLIIEGYWFSSTDSNGNYAPWMFENNQKGRSALVRNNVQLVFRYPTPEDPDTNGESDRNAQPGRGYILQGASFGSLVEGNIITGAMLEDDLGDDASGIAGLSIIPQPAMQEEGGKTLTQRNNEVRDNIAYRVGVGLSLEGDWSNTEGLSASGNVFVAPNGVNTPPDALGEQAQLLLSENRFYTDNGLPGVVNGLSVDNVTKALGNAANAESWPDPDRTLRRYVTEELGLELLDWEDDPFLEEGARDERAASGEQYDPAGIKTFMAVAINMRRGGRTAAPSAGKPDWRGDYAWDDRYTGTAVTNWIRAGFGLPEVK